MKNKMVVVLTGLILVLAVVLYFEHTRLEKLRSEGAAAKERLAELEKENQGLDTRLRMYTKIAGDLEKKLAELDRERSLLTARLKESEDKLNRIKPQVEAMTPDELVQETRRILKDAGVEKIDVGARFTLTAFRKNTAILKEWEEFSLVKVPLLEEQVRTQERAITNLHNQVLVWKEADRLWGQKEAIWREERTVMNSLLLNYEKQLVSQKRQKTWFFVLGVLAGAGAHALLK